MGLAGLMVLLSCATKLGDGVVQTLVVERVGVVLVPRVFALNAVLDVVGGALYLRLARGRGHGSFFVALLVGTAATSVALRALLLGSHPAVFLTAFVVHGVTTMIVTLHWGTFLLDFFPASRAALALPVVYSGARVGGIAGGLLLVGLARAGTENLLVAVGAIQLVAAGAARILARRLPEVHAAGDPAASLFGELLQGARLARTSPLLRALAIGGIAMVLVRQVLRYLSGDALSGAMDEATLAQFLGKYTAIANAIGFLFQVLLMPRLNERIGVAATNLAYAMLCFVAVGGMAVSQGVWAAAAARLMDAELKDAIKTPLSALFYGALPPAARARGRAFVLGLAIPAGSVLGGLGLQALTGLPARSVAWLGLGLGALFVVATVVQNRGYRRALRERLAAAAPGSPESADLSRALERLSPGPRA